MHTLMRVKSSMPAPAPPPPQQVTCDVVQAQEEQVPLTRMISFSSMPMPTRVVGEVVPVPKTISEAVPRPVLPPPPVGGYQKCALNILEQYMARLRDMFRGRGCRPSWVVDLRNVVLKSMHCDIAIEGSAVTLSISQTYRNDTNRPLEVLFAMGLGSMAVTSLECERDGVVVSAEIKPSAKARDDYDDSISMGHTATLGEFNAKERVFEMSLGNLTPGSTLTARLKLIAALEGDAESLWFGLPNDFFPHSGCEFQVSVKASFPDGIDTMTVTQGTTTWLADEKNQYSSTAPVGREGIFAVRVTPKKKFEPNCLLEENGTSRALALTFFPTWEHLDKDLFTPYVEVVFLVDRSGSMGQGFGPARGLRLKKARETLALFLSSLPQNCRFQIIGFGSRFVPLFPKGPELYTPETLKIAQEHVKTMEADLGGTDLLAPLKDVLAKPALPDYPRHVFVLTDGNVNNRDDTITHVLKWRGATVIHAVGLGNGADAALVQGVAHAGNGLSDMIPDNGDMRGVVIRQLARALEPTLRKVRLEFVNCKAEHVAPATLPAVANGERLTVHALNVEFEEGAAAAVALSGIAPDESEYKCVLSLDKVPRVQGKAVHLLAAHSVVRELEQHEGKGSDKIIEALGLKYSLVTSKTSFGAMFENEKLPEGEMVAVNVQTLGDKSEPVFFRRVFAPASHAKSDRLRKKSEGPATSSSSSSFGAFLSAGEEKKSRRSSFDSRDEMGHALSKPAARASAKLAQEERSKSTAQPRRRLSAESHGKDGGAIHKSDLVYDSYDMDEEESEKGGSGSPSLGLQKSAPPRPVASPGAPPPAPASSSPSPPTAPLQQQGARLPAKPASPSSPASASGGSDVVMRAATAQDATGFWTLEAAIALTGIKGAADPSGAANSALFATALVVEWLAAKHAASEPEWKLLVQKARTWLKKQQIALKLQDTDFLSLARALVK